MRSCFRMSTSEEHPPSSQPWNASRGLLDTSVVIDLDLIHGEDLPAETAISAITLAELAAGPHATTGGEERGRRQDRLQWAAATWDPLPIDADVARATVRGSGRASRRRFADLLIAATTVAHGFIATAAAKPISCSTAADVSGWRTPSGASIPVPARRRRYAGSLVSCPPTRSRP